MPGGLAFTTADQREYRQRKRVAGQCKDCSEPALPGRTLCQKHRKLRLAGERRRLAKRRMEVPDLPGPSSEPILMLVSWLAEDKRASKSWTAAWNHRYRQVLAAVDPAERGFWRDVFRASHVRAAFKAAYLGTGKRLQLSRVLYERLIGPRQ